MIRAYVDMIQIEKAEYNVAFILSIYFQAMRYHSQSPRIEHISYRSITLGKGTDGWGIWGKLVVDSFARRLSSRERPYGNTYAIAKYMILAPIPWV